MVGSYLMNVPGMISLTEADLIILYLKKKFPDDEEVDNLVHCIYMLRGAKAHVEELEKID